VTRQTFIEAVGELYNRAQIDVLARAGILSDEQVRHDRAKATTPSRGRTRERLDLVLGTRFLLGNGSIETRSIPQNHDKKGIRIMNFFHELISTFQDLVAQVPDFVQPLVVMLAGAIPAVEGDVAAVIGIVSGLNPIVAAIAGATGNFVTVLFTVLLTSRVRTAVVNRMALVGATAGAAESSAFGSDQSAATDEATASVKPESKGRQKGRQRLNKWFVRFGVPGASLLGPLALPTQVTSAILVAGGSPRAWVLLWQAAAIALWTTVASVSAWLALTYVVGV
jgi:hypothetical protein